MPRPPVFRITATIVAVSGLILSSLVNAAAQDYSGNPHSSIDLDDYIASQKPLRKGTRTFLPPEFVEFDAVIKRHPEEITVKYLYKALTMMKVDPLPAVSHRMFVQSPDGKIIPVYVEDRAVPGIQSRTTVDGEARLRGYRAYNYSKGPAIVIHDVK